MTQEPLIIVTGHPEIALKVVPGRLLEVAHR